MAPDKSHPEAGFVEFEPVVIGIVDFVFVLIAAACLLLVGAGWVWGWLIVQLFGGISILGFHPFASLGNAIEGAMASIARPLISRVVAFGHAAWSLVMVLWRFVYVVTVGLGGLALRITGVSQDSQSGLASVRAYVDSQISALVLYTEGLFGIENQKIATAEAEAAQEAAQATATSIAFTQAEVAGANAHSDQLFNRAEADIGTNLRTAENFAVAQANAVRTTLNADVSTINATITRDVTDLRQADATNLRTAENFATGLVNGLGVGALRQTVTALQSELNQVKTETTECLDPLCNTVTPQAKRLGNLGKWFQDLEALAAAALLIAIAEEAVHDPGGVAHDIEAVVQGAGSDVLQGFRDLIGL